MDVAISGSASNLFYESVLSITPDYTAIQSVVSLFHIDKLQHDVYLPEQNESKLIQRFQSHTDLFETYYKNYPFKQLFMTLSLKRCITILRHFCLL